ncbi:ParB/RepB/Spo0J family partition protein [Actinomadura rayongensis]|uniref:ParB N-terminal domain-containing protein n=1 Tax=Actinomadura rayongensis TaxID=1429076 RepID=A0A6I4WF94_9ACTN|nr:ParB/RepB/Spo0J family partition protein [Actinomadura rayongensis]MXQ67713.1 ParB N-terminal domain-containing protein [Actinomadura rayongensis]
MQLPDQRYEVVPIDQVQPHPDNPRRGDTDAIADSVEANGWYGAVVAQRSTGHILVGTHRWLALQSKRANEIPVIWLDVSDDRAKRVMLADNRTADRAVYDDAGLLSLLEDLAASPNVLAGTGYGLDELEDLRAELDVIPTVTPPSTDAAYAETPEEEDARVAALGHNSRNAAGLRELVVVLPLARHGAAMARLAELRKVAGDEVSSGEVVLAALNLADPAALVAELVALRTADDQADDDQEHDGQEDADGGAGDGEAA